MTYPLAALFAAWLATKTHLLVIGNLALYQNLLPGTHQGCHYILSISIVIANETEKIKPVVRTNRVYV